MLWLLVSNSTMVFVWVLHWSPGLWNSHYTALGIGKRGVTATNLKNWESALTIAFPIREYRLHHENFRHMKKVMKYFFHYVLHCKSRAQFMPVVHVLHKAHWELLIKEAWKTPRVCSCIIKPLVNKLNAGSSVLIPVYISVLSLEQRNWLKTGLKTKTASFPSDVISEVTQSTSTADATFSSSVRKAQNLASSSCFICSMGPTRPTPLFHITIHHHLQSTPQRVGPFCSHFPPLSHLSPTSQQPPAFSSHSRHALSLLTLSSPQPSLHQQFQQLLPLLPTVRILMLSSATPRPFLPSPASSALYLQCTH